MQPPRRSQDRRLSTRGGARQGRWLFWALFRSRGTDGFLLSHHTAKFNSRGVGCWHRLGQLPPSMSSLRKQGGGFTLEVQQLSKGLGGRAEVKAFARGVVVSGNETGKATGWGGGGGGVSRHGRVP